MKEKRGLFEDPTLATKRMRDRLSSADRFFVAICLAVLVVIARDFYRLWGLPGLIPSIIVAVGLFGRIPVLSAFGVPVVVAYPWILWLHSGETSVFFWLLIAVYAIHFASRRMRDKRTSEGG